MLFENFDFFLKTFFRYKMSYLEIASAIAKMPQHGESFKKNGTIELLAKNRELKQGPENFINTTARFDIVFTVEQGLIDKVISLLDKLVSRGQIPDPVPRNNGFGSTKSLKIFKTRIFGKNMINF